MLDPIRDFPWLRHGYEQGVEKGITEGMASSVLMVLVGRGLVVDEITRQRILRCQDQVKLQGWLVRAATAASAAEVIGKD